MLLLLLPVRSELEEWLVFGGCLPTIFIPDAWLLWPAKRFTSDVDKVSLAILYFVVNNKSASNANAKLVGGRKTSRNVFIVFFQHLLHIFLLLRGNKDLHGKWPRNITFIVIASVFFNNSM